MDVNGKRYLGELFGVVTLYLVALFGSVWLLQLIPAGAPRILIALVPMLPALLLPVVVVRLLRRMDELQRRIQLEALGFAFAATAVLTFGYGFLEVGGLPRLSSFAVWPLMGALWGVGVWVANRRFG